MLDLLIRGGTLIDGTGNPGVPADVAIRDGRIAGIGAAESSAHDEIDARGCVVAPGFVDIHTHYDAQAFWDPELTPSSEHGVTTVIGGNCGFSLAPLPESARDYVRRMLARVEGMPLESLEQGVPWNWRGFDEYLARLEGRLAINAGFLVGHSTLRRAVLGEEASVRPATDDEVEWMRGELAAALAQGGLGFSTSLAPTHLDGDGAPVPSRRAAPDEILALCREVASHPGTTVEMVPPVDPFPAELVELMIGMSRAAQRPLNWNVLNVDAARPEIHESQLAASDAARTRGARIVALTLPRVVGVRINLRSAFLFDALPGWGEVMALPLEARRRALADRTVRARLAAGARSDEAGVLRNVTDWDTMRVAETFTPALAGLEGRTLGEIARERREEPFDLLMDVALQEELRTCFEPRIPGDDPESWELRGRVWNDPRTLVGASDAGAHLDMIDSFAFSSVLLAEGVRERGLITLEAAVRELTDLPARLYGLRDRGRLAVGAHADLVIFDPDSIGPGPLRTRTDLPAGASRLYAEGRGIAAVVVGGVPIRRDGRATGARPGRILRSTRDLDTVHP